MTAIEQEASVEPEMGGADADAGWGEAKLVDGTRIMFNIILIVLIVLCFHTSVLYTTDQSLGEL